MVRAPFYDKSGVKKGAWSAEEDDKLRAYIQSYGHWNRRELPKYAGISRCGKSCRLRWKNYLQPGVKHGDFTEEEDALIIKLHEQLGNKWSIIAAKLPGRTDNEIKNHWRIHMKKKCNNEQQNQTSSTQQSCDDHECSSRKNNSDNQLEAQKSANRNCNDAFLQLLHPQILESSASPVVSPESTFSSSTSSAKYSSSSSSSSPSSFSPSSSANHESHGSTVVLSYLADQDTAMISSSETMILAQEYDAGDFWTKPFLQDNICMGSDVISSSPSYLLSYDEGMDLFYQVMPAPQEFS